MHIFLAFTCGLIFGLGLIAAGMGDPYKVLAFLDVAGRWDPSLALVMAAAVGISVLPFAWARRRSTSWLGKPMPALHPQPVDLGLLLGSAFFGIGWGLAGFCPGPAILSLGAAYLPGIAFTFAMAFGMEAFEWAVDAGKIPAPAASESPNA